MFPRLRLFTKFSLAYLSPSAVGPAWDATRGGVGGGGAAPVGPASRHTT